MKQKLFSILALLLVAVSGAWAQDYYAPSTDEVIILNEVYNASNSGYSSHSAIAWGGSATVSMKTAGDPNNGGQPTSSTVNCYSVKGTGQGKNITLSITGVSKVIVYHQRGNTEYIQLRDGSKNGNIIGSGQTNTFYTEVALTATNKYSIFLHGTRDGSDDVDFHVYAIKLIAAPAPAATGYSITLDEGTGNKDSQNWEIKPKSSELSGGEDVTVKYNGSREVKSVTVVKKAAVNPNAYMKWNRKQKQLVATEMPTTYKTVENANAGVTWEAGTYVVEGQVTISGMIELSGAVELIIKDGAKLTVNGQIDGGTNKLYIYGQAGMSGELVVNCSDDNAITNLSTLEVHSAKVTATSSLGGSGGFFGISTFNVYGGLVDAKTTAEGGYGICLKAGGSMDIYGGEVKAEGNGNGGGWDCGIVCGSPTNKATVTVHGGKLWAGNADNKALNFVTLTIDKSPSFNFEIQTSSDNSTWNPTVGTPDSKYVRVGY